MGFHFLFMRKLIKYVSNMKRSGCQKALISGLLSLCYSFLSIREEVRVVTTSLFFYSLSLCCLLMNNFYFFSFVLKKNLIPNLLYLFIFLKNNHTFLFFSRSRIFLCYAFLSNENK